MSWFATIVFSNITGIRKGGRARVRAKGLCLRILAEREVVGAELSFLQNKKNEERSKHPIENLSEVSSQKSEKSCLG
jgi:hypothetical protein